MLSCVSCKRLASLSALFATSFSLSVSAAAQQSAPANPAYLNPALPVDQRVDDLVSRMTLEEEASQVVHQAAAIPRLKIPAYN